MEGVYSGLSQAIQHGSDEINSDLNNRNNHAFMMKLESATLEAEHNNRLNEMQQSVSGQKELQKSAAGIEHDKYINEHFLSPEVTSVLSTTLGSPVKIGQHEFPGIDISGIKPGARISIEDAKTLMQLHKQNVGTFAPVIVFAHLYLADRHTRQ